MGGDESDLTEAERTWLTKNEERWRRARELASRHPGMDPGGVYHVLRNLEKTPSERLRAALTQGAIRFCEARLGSAMRAVETGSGRSTAWFARRVGHVIQGANSSTTIDLVRRHIRPSTG